MANNQQEPLGKSQNPPPTLIQSVLDGKTSLEAASSFISSVMDQAKTPDKSHDNDSVGMPPLVKDKGLSAAPPTTLSSGTRVGHTVPLVDTYSPSEMRDMVRNRIIPGFPITRRQEVFDKWATDTHFYVYVSDEIQERYNEDVTPSAYRNATVFYEVLRSAYARSGIVLRTDLVDFPPAESSSSDSDEFFDPSTYKPPFKAEEKGWFDRAKTFHVELDSEDRGLIKRALESADKAKAVVSDAVRAIPSHMSDGAKQAVTVVKDGLIDMWNHATFVKFPQSVREFLILLLEVIPLAMCDDKTVWMCSNIRLAYTQGVMRLAMIDGVALFVKQILKRFVRATDQPAPEETDPDLVSSMSAVVAAVHYFAVGWIPDIVPSNLLKLMISANVAFTLARNFEHFAQFLLKMVRMACDVVWTMITGKPWFDQTQRAAIDKAADMVVHLGVYCTKHDPNRNDIYLCKKLVLEAEAAYASAVAADIPKEKLEQLRNMISTTDKWIAANAGPAEYTDMRSLTVIFGMNGASGCGKTTAFRYAVSALAKKKGIAGDLLKLMVVYDPDVNFQAPLPLEAKFLLIDDAFLMIDPAGHIKTYSYLGKLGSATPILQDDPLAPKKGQTYQHFRYCGVINNVRPVVPANAAEPIPRRYIGGDHTFVPLPFGMDADGHFDPDKVPIDNPQDHLNRCWDIIDHAGVHRNFTEWVDMLDEVDNRVCARSRSLEASMVSLSQKYTSSNVPPVVSAPPKKFTPSSDLTNPSPPPQPVPDIIGIGYKKGNAREYKKKKARDQMLQTNASDNEIREWLYNKASSSEANEEFTNRMIKYMRRTKALYIFDKNDKTMCRDGKFIHASDLWKSMIREPPVTAIDLKVKPNLWTPALLDEFKGKRFTIKGRCCMYDNYCFRHEYEPCSAWDDDAAETGHTGFAHWVTHNPDLNAPQMPYFAFLAGLYSADEDGLVATAVKGFIFTMGAITTGLFVVNLISMVVGSFGRPMGREQAAYTNTGLKTARRTTTPVLPVLTFGAKDQSKDDIPTDLPQGLSHQFILRKFRDNIVPIQVIEPTAKMSLSMTRIVGNLATTVKHVFTKGATHIALGGLIGAKYPLRFVSDPNQWEENSVFVQVWFDPEQDLAWLLLPKSLITDRKSVV